MAELAFERLAVALEGVSTRGTPVTPPTHWLNLAGMLTPQQEKYRPDESRGLLAAATRSKTVKRWSTWEASGGADPRALLFLLSMVMQNTPSPSVVTASQTWLWTFTRAMTSDAIRSATLYWGDPNIQIFQGAFAMAEEFSLSGAGAGGIENSISGVSEFPAAVATPTFPAQSLGPLLAMLDTQVYLDTSSPIGTTEVAGRLVSFDLSIPTGVTPKWVASGPSGGKNFTRVGRAKTSPELTMVFEFDNLNEYNLYANNDGDTAVRARLLLNGPIIEATNRHFVRIDAIGPVDSLAWGDHEGTNRTLELAWIAEYDATAATDLTVAVQTNTGTL